MADEDKKDSTGLSSSTGFAWIAMIAAGAFFIHQVPLQGSRPASTEQKPYAYPAAQDIDARLWQDPLTAVAHGRDAVRKQYPERTAAGSLTVLAAEARNDPVVPEPTEQTEHDPSRLRDAVVSRTAATTDHRAPLVLAVMVRGGAYADSVESRRRARYAVLAGMQQFGYTPEDSAHLGYVLPHNAIGERAPLPDFIAYEWLRRNVESPWVLTLWLDEYMFSTKTLQRLCRLQQALTPPAGAGDAGGVPPRFVVVGPAYGSTVHDMALRASGPQDASQKACRDALNVAPLDFYAYGVSADDAHVLQGIGAKAAGRSLESVFGELFGDSVHMTRTLNDDRTLAQTLKSELRLRGVDPVAAACGHRPQHIVLIAERDTLYGRSLPAVVADQFDKPGCAPVGLDYIHRYTYLRGLDGQLPSTSSDARPADDPKAASPADEAPAAVQKQIERPEGQSQIDYLRRLTQQLVEADAAWQRDGQGSIKAIGVVGSDVFDKLLVLQALRPAFRNVIFFTTDLDARLLHPREQGWARNLVVASSFGLRLRPELQNDIPPFRDSYQTSIYLSTLIAAHNATIADGSHGVDPIRQSDVDGWLGHGRVFEVGRTRPFDFSEPKARDLPPCIGVDPVSGIDPARCKAVQPAGMDLFERPGTFAFYKSIFLVLGIAAVVAGAMGYLSRALEYARASIVGPGIATWFGKLGPRGLLRIVLVAALVVVVATLPVLAWPAIARLLTEHGNGEPMAFVEGISIWPTETIRLAAFVLSVWFARVAWRQLNANLRAISQKLRFEPVYEEMVAQAAEDYSEWSRPKRIFRAFSFRLNEVAAAPQRLTVGLSWSAQLFWKKYLYQGRGGARSARVTLAVLFYLVLALVIVSDFGWPNTPYRGTVSPLVNAVVVMLSVGAMLWVIFFVVDATVFCCQIIDALRDDVLRDPSVPAGPGVTRWAYSTLRYYTDRLKIDARYLDAWILMDFIALRTEAVAKLVYFPFIIIALMALSRDRVFDNWTMPAGLVIVFASSIAIVIVCAVLLRRTAERTRERVLELLNDDLIRVKGHDENAVPQLEAMIARVRRLRTGALAPYSQQPIVHAALATFTTLGGPALLDYFGVVGG